MSFLGIKSTFGHMVTDVDYYLSEGCMRCKLGGTPNCKVHTWADELVALRQIVLATGLTETIKWSMPCYTHNGKNVLIISAFKAYASLNFFNGAMLRDEANILIKAGEHSHESRQLRFTSTPDIQQQEDLIKAYIFEAMDLAQANQKTAAQPKPKIAFPQELIEMMEALPALKTAFNALTPGRQRGYLIYFTQPKQSQTRTNRIEKYLTKILSGKGFHD